MILDVLTDNKNRTVGELRHLLEKHGGNLASTSAVAWMFSKKGYIVVEKTKADEEKLMAAVIEAGGRRPAGRRGQLGSAVVARGVPGGARGGEGARHRAGHARRSPMMPQNYVKLEGKAAQQMVRLMEALEEHDDMQHVWSNFDISEKEIEASLA